MIGELRLQQFRELDELGLRERVCGSGSERQLKLFFVSKKKKVGSRDRLEDVS